MYVHVLQIVEKIDMCGDRIHYIPSISIFIPISTFIVLATTGMIELHEFLMLLKSQHKEAQARIKELVEAPIMVLKSDTSKQYLPPTKGTR